MSSVEEQWCWAPCWIHVGPVLVGERRKAQRLCSGQKGMEQLRQPWGTCIHGSFALSLSRQPEPSPSWVWGCWNADGERLQRQEVSWVQHSCVCPDGEGIGEWECRAGGNSAGKKSPNLSCHQDKIMSGWDLAWAKPPCSGKPVTSRLLLSYAGVKSALSWGAAGLSTYLIVSWLCGPGRRGQPEWLQAGGFCTRLQPQRSRAVPVQSQLIVLMYNCKQFPSRSRKAEQGPCLLYPSYFFPWRQAARVGFQPGGCLGQWRKGTRTRLLHSAEPVIVSGYYNLLVMLMRSPNINTAFLTHSLGTWKNPLASAQEKAGSNRNTVGINHQRKKEPAYCQPA